MRYHGATRVFAKVLAANDNSKNQIYLGGGFAALNVIPHGEIYVDTEEKAGSKQDRPKAPVKFFWLNDNGRHLAPGANLILYPDYPEVRLSGLLKGCRPSPSALVRPRLDGRVMFFGVTPDREVLGYIVADGDPVGEEVKAGSWDELGVFLELPIKRGRDPKSMLLAELRRIHELGWINSQKLEKDGTKRPYRAQNGGGYTLEAELGITPNGVGEPDFMGWEVKQYGVRNFDRYAPKTPVTLMTPEPNGGLYKTAGLEEFVRLYGYDDRRGKANRRNFGGVHKCDAPHHKLTGLQMTVEGFDPTSGKITEMGGGFKLRDNQGEEAASWSFKGLIEHWNRKHAQAVYVPSLRSPANQYRYADQVLLCEGTDFMMFLKAFMAGQVYYDPAMKVVGIAPNIDTKKRSQFRVRHAELGMLYHKSETIQLPL